MEVDVWVTDKIYLGHDCPQYKINKDFFNSKMWIHCKNIAAVEYMKNTNLNWFWHNNDKLTITSHGHIWCYPGIYIENGLTVDCGEPHNINKKIMGICTDYPLKWKKYNNTRKLQ